MSSPKASRRALLQMLLTVPAASVLGGCQELFSDLRSGRSKHPKQELEAVGPGVEHPAIPLVLGPLLVQQVETSTTLPVVVRVRVTRESGARLSDGALVLEAHQDGQVVARANAVAEGAYDFGTYLATLELANEGAQTLKAVVAGKSQSATDLKVTRVPAVGGPIYAANARHGAAELRKTESTPAVQHLHVTRWRGLDWDPAVIVEWRRGGEVVHTDKLREDCSVVRRRLSRPPGTKPWPENVPAWEYAALRLNVPVGWDLDGEWEVLVHEERQPSLRIVPHGPVLTKGLELRAVSAAEIETPAAVRKELAALPLLEVPDWMDVPVTAEEFRALTRSPELFKMRKEIAQIHHGLPRRRELPWIDGESPTAHRQRQRAEDAQTDREAKQTEREDRRQRAEIYAKMKPMIRSLGGPWTAEETPG